VNLLGVLRQLLVVCVVFVGELYLKYQLKGSSFRSISSFLILLTPFLRADYKEGVWSKSRSIYITVSSVTNSVLSGPLTS